MKRPNPSFPEFKRLAGKYNVIPLVQEVIADRVTPVSVYEELSRGESHAFLLESVEGGYSVGRYSFVGRRPHALFTCRGGMVQYQEGPVQKSWPTINPLQDLKSVFQRIRAAPRADLPRFFGGAVGYWDYDTVRFFERLPNGKSNTLGLPHGAFQLTGDVVVFDRLSHTASVMTNLFIPEKACSGSRLRVLYEGGLRSLEDQIQRIQHPRAVESRVTRRKRMVLTQPERERMRYRTAVQKAKSYIRAGDIIQVVLSQRWVLQPQATPFQVYRALRLVNPSPYMYFLHFPEFDVVGSSPELLVRKEGETVETRPIAGTRPRATEPEEDQKLEEQLKNDAKERAEHLMLVDLGRNDLGRVSRPGTVRVADFMNVERYSHVMHLVSSVTGKISPRANAFDLFQACFPAGTVSGAPKIRAMQIIDELETASRGLYAGAVGYFSYTGNMDMAITIRTLVFQGGKAYLQAGAGIVADSVPEREDRECRQKAAALIAAVEKASDFS